MNTVAWLRITHTHRHMTFAEMESVVQRRTKAFNLSWNGMCTAVNAHHCKLQNEVDKDFMTDICSVLPISSHQCTHFLLLPFMHSWTDLLLLTCSQSLSCWDHFPPAVHWNVAFWPTLTSTFCRRKKCGALPARWTIMCEAESVQRWIKSTVNTLQKWHFKEKI